MPSECISQTTSSVPSLLLRPPLPAHPPARRPIKIPKQQRCAGRIASEACSQAPDTMRRGSARVQRRLGKSWRAAGGGWYGRRMAVDKRRGRLFFARIGVLRLAFYASDILSREATVSSAGCPEHPRTTGCGGIVRCDVIFPFLFGIWWIWHGCIEAVSVVLVRYYGVRMPGFQTS